MMDYYYSVARCRSALAALNALIVGANSRDMRRHFERREAFWTEQLEFATKREQLPIETERNSPIRPVKENTG